MRQKKATTVEKKYDAFIPMSVSYPEVIGLAYSFKEVFLYRQGQDSDKSIVVYIEGRFYFEDGKLKTDLLDDSWLEEDDCDDLDEWLNMKYCKFNVLVPFASGTWEAIKDRVGIASRCIAGQECLNFDIEDPLMVDYDNVTKKLLLCEGSKILFELRGDVCDRCVCYTMGKNFPLPSRCLIWPENIDEAMKKWEKMKY